MTQMNPYYIEVFNFLLKGGMLTIGALVGFSLHRWLKSKKHPFLQLITSWIICLCLINTVFFFVELSPAQHWAKTLVEISMATFGMINIVFVLIYTLGWGIGWQLQKYYNKMDKNIKHSSKA